MHSPQEPVFRYYMQIAALPVSVALDITMEDLIFMRQREAQNPDLKQAFQYLEEEVTSENDWQLREVDPQRNSS